LEPVGGVITEMRLTDAGVQTTFEAPAMVPPPVVGRHLTDRWPDARLSVIWHSAPTGPEDRFSDVLTDKQLEALRTALRMGFFDRPQRATANEIADLLDVSRSTFLHHLRGAEATLLGRVL
jgi:DNA-binding transcriptional ArsR family regulator